MRSSAVNPRIITEMQVFESERTGCAYLRDVLTGFGPVEVRRVSRQNDDAARRIGLYLVAVELIAEADVEHARHDRVDPVLRMPVRHQLCAAGRLHPDHVRSGLGGIADEHGKTHRRRKGRKRFPVDVLGQDRSERILAWLMAAKS